MIARSVAVAWLGAVTVTAQGERPGWLGSWVAGEPAAAIRFENNRCSWLRDGELRFYRLAVRGDRLRLETSAKVTWLSPRVRDGVLVLGDGADEIEYASVEDVPDSLRVDPLVLPDEPPGEIDAEAIAKEILDRSSEDQRVRRAGHATGYDEDSRAEIERIDKANTSYLVELLETVGWIDVERFGSRASMAAFLLVQHSGNLRLMRTALPRIHVDVQAGRLNGQAYALLYDRLHLTLGYRQRYGSQLGETEDGTPVLLPCEDVDIDQEREALGMQSLEGYFSMFRLDEPVRTLDEVLSETEGETDR